MHPYASKTHAKTTPFAENKNKFIKDEAIQTRNKSYHYVYNCFKNYTLKQA